MVSVETTDTQGNKVKRRRKKLRDLIPSKLGGPKTQTVDEEGESEDDDDEGGGAAGGDGHKPTKCKCAGDTAHYKVRLVARVLARRLRLTSHRRRPSMPRSPRRRKRFSSV
jgi:hypothetical protein